MFGDSSSSSCSFLERKANWGENTDFKSKFLQKLSNTHDCFYWVINDHGFSVFNVEGRVF